jgi:hypothetical protein
MKLPSLGDRNWQDASAWTGCRAGQQRKSSSATRITRIQGARIALKERNWLRFARREDSKELAHLKLPPPNST